MAGSSYLSFEADGCVAAQFQRRRASLSWLRQPLMSNVAIMKIVSLTLLFSGLIGAGCARATQAPAWAVGFWAQVLDEDGRPGDDTLHFREDGTLVVYGSKCQQFPAGEFHLYQGNIYATFKTPKGLVAAVYVPSQQHQRLTFTSPRTGNNAVYAPAKGCVPVGG
jgi:hypothetical protein